MDCISLSDGKLHPLMVNYQVIWNLQLHKIAANRLSTCCGLCSEIWMFMDWLSWWLKCQQKLLFVSLLLCSLAVAYGIGSHHKVQSLSHSEDGHLVSGHPVQFADLVSRQQCDSHGLWQLLISCWWDAAFFYLQASVKIQNSNLKEES